MEDFSNDLFSSFFDDPVLDEKSPLLDMELDSPTPGIQAEHSYSLSGDSAPQSPLVPIKMEDTTQGKKRWKGPGTAWKAHEGGMPLSELQRGDCRQRLPEALRGATHKCLSGRLPPAFLFSLKSNPHWLSQKEFIADFGQ